MNQKSVEYNKYIQNETEGMRLKEKGKRKNRNDNIHIRIYVCITTIH